MSTKTLLLNSDTFTFSSIQGATLLGPTSTKIIGSSKASENGRNVCLEGDEKSVIHQIAYKSQSLQEPQTPGMLTCTIKNLGSDNFSAHSTESDKKVLLVGSQNVVTNYTVTFPAMQNIPGTPPVPDPKPIYSGKGYFSQSPSSKASEI